MNQGATGSSGNVQLPTAWEHGATIPKNNPGNKKVSFGQKVSFGRYSVTLPVEACSMLQISDRARKCFGYSSVKLCSKADRSPIFSSTVGLSAQKCGWLQKTENLLTEVGVEPEVWQTHWTELQNISSGLKALLDEQTGRDSGEMFHAVKSNKELSDALFGMAQREQRGDPGAVLQAMIIDFRIADYLCLADYEKPFFDWRSIYSPVVEDKYYSGRRGTSDATKSGAEAVTMKMPSHEICSRRLSLNDIKEKAKAYGIPDVGYAPSKFYDSGCVLFPITKAGRAAVRQFSTIRQEQLRDLEQRLEKEGISEELFAAHWSFVCEYSGILTASGKKKPGTNLRRWLATVAADEEKKTLSGILLSLMLDYLTVLVELSAEKNKKNASVRPRYDWRERCSSAQPFLHREMLDCFKIEVESSDEESEVEVELVDEEVVTAPAQQRMHKRTRSDDDDDDGEGAWEYEIKRKKELDLLQEKHQRGRAIKS